MNTALSADDVLRSIEFELVQGAISHDDLGQSIRAVRQYQNKVRGEILDAARQPENTREVVTRLFQINEMLITIVQEMNATLQSLRVDLRKVARMSQMASSKAVAPPAPAGESKGHARTGMDASTSVGLNQGADRHLPSDVGGAMRAGALEVDLDARPVSVPIIGGLLRRLRLALHDLVLFYIRELAQKQAAVNQTYGEWVLHLIEMSEHQQGQVDLLSARVAALEAALTEADE